MKFSLRATKAKMIKAIAVIVTILSTAACIAYNYYSNYVAPVDSSLRNFEFTIDVINALIVFAMGYLFTYAQNIRHNNYPYLKTLHKELSNINTLFSAHELDVNDDNSIVRFIISFQVFTSRTEEMVEEEVMPYFTMNHLTINKMYLKYERDFRPSQLKLLKQLEEKMAEYALQNALQRQHPNGSLSLWDLKTFMDNPTNWIDSHYIVTEREKADFEKYAFVVLASEKKSIKNIRNLSKKNVRQAKMAAKKMAKAKKWIEKNYGERLAEDNRIELIDEKLNLALNGLDKNNERISTLSKELENLNDKIDST